MCVFFYIFDGFGIVLLISAKRAKFVYYVTTSFCCSADSCDDVCHSVFVLDTIMNLDLAGDLVTQAVRIPSEKVKIPQTSAPKS